MNMIETKELCTNDDIEKNETMAGLAFLITDVDENHSCLAHSRTITDEL